jgi:hypothetical protein
MNEIVAPFLVVVVGTMALALLLAFGSYDKRERAGIGASFAVRVLCAFGMVWLTDVAWGGSADMFAYHQVGTSLTRYLRLDFEYVAPEVAALLFQQDAVLPVYIFGAGSSTGSMTAIVAFIELVVNDSLYATALVITIVSFFSQLTLYQVARESLTEIYRTRMLFAILLLPSVVFWSSGIVKESLALAGVCLLTFGMHRLGGKRIIAAVVAGALGLLLTGLTKAYFLFVFAIAAAVWFYWRYAVHAEGRFRLRPVHLVIVCVVAVGGVILLGQIFPRYSFTNIAPEVARMQAWGSTIRGGSGYVIGDANAVTLGGQLAFAPIGFIYALARPALFEMSNAPMAASAIEATFLTLALLRLLWTRRWVDTWRMLTSSPFLVYSIVFTLGVAVAVGIATTNLGTLVRYRMPILPFYALVLFVLNAKGLTETARERPTMRAVGAVPTQARVPAAGLSQRSR